MFWPLQKKLMISITIDRDRKSQLTSLDETIDWIYDPLSREGHLRIRSSCSTGAVLSESDSVCLSLSLYFSLSFSLCLCVSLEKDGNDVLDKFHNCLMHDWDCRLLFRTPAMCKLMFASGKSLLINKWKLHEKHRLNNRQLSFISCPGPLVARKTC